MRATFAAALQAAQTESIILLTGESGSGKDYLARYIHDHSRQSGGPFYVINCAAISHELAESELFGHETGAFTGAKGRKRGLLELAEGGTLLLNEIAELSSIVQAKLFTFLDTRSFPRVGGEKNIRVNARLIAATHRDLAKEVAAGRFLPPLFYRLNVLSLKVPPLRERMEDIPVLVKELLAKLGSEMHLSSVPIIDDSTVQALNRYNWPGNVRELRNVVERILMSSGQEGFDLRLGTFDDGNSDWAYTVRFPDDMSLHDLADQVNYRVCLEALRRSGGNKKRAAASVGISRDCFYRYMKAGASRAKLRHTTEPVREYKSTQNR